MAPSHDDDIDWLYQRDKSSAQNPEPEPTRVFEAGAFGAPEEPRPASSSRAQSQPQKPVRPQSRQPVQPPPPPSARAARSGPRRPRRPGRRIATVIGVVVVVVLVWLIAVPVYAWSHVNRVAYEPSGSRPADQPGTTYLLLGSDSRAGLTKEEKKKLGTGSAAGARTDTIMILYVPPGGEPALISIPRDSYVSIPGHGMNKINAAYSFGGGKLMTQTVEQNTGLRIDEYVEVGFAGFINVVDAVGGYHVCLKKPLKDKDSHLDLKAGCQTLVGKNALGYVRERHADPLGDLGRVERQRAVVNQTAKKAASPATLLNPFRYWSLANAGTDSLAVGDNASMLSMVRMALAMSKASGSTGLTLTVPVANPNYNTPAGSSVLWNQSEAKAMFADIARGDTASLKKYAK